MFLTGRLLIQSNGTFASATTQQPLVHSLPVQLVVPREEQTQEKDTEEVNRMSVVAERVRWWGGLGVRPSALGGRLRNNKYFVLFEVRLV